MSISYIIPTVKNENDFANKVYFDPTYGGGDSDGSISKPYTIYNALYSTYGVPSNTAFLFKRGTQWHEKLGRLSTSGSGIDTMIYSNNMIGAYGSGSKPIIPGIWIASNSDGLTIRDLNIQTPSQDGHRTRDIIITLWAGDGSRPKNITVAYSILNGVYNSGGIWDAWGVRPYPWMGIRGGGDNIVLFNNIVSNVGNDGIYLDAHEGYKVVRNYVYNTNRHNWGVGDPNADTGGDGILLGYSFKNAYVAGNLVDVARDYYDEHPEGDDFWKHTLIANASSTGGWDAPNAQITVEYNTFISPPINSGSGGIIYYNPSENSQFSHNLLRPTQGQKGRGALRGSGYTLLDHLAKDQPYGIYENHIIRENSNNVLFPDDDQAVLDAGNEIFDTFAEYDTYLETNDAVGSDIDPDDFIWDVVPPTTPITGKGQAEIISHKTASVGSDTTSITIDKPDDVEEDDMLLAVIVAYRRYSGDHGITLPINWVSIYDASGTTGHGSNLAIIAYKIAGDSEPSDYEFQFDGNVHPLGRIFRIIGVDVSVPIGAISSPFLHQSNWTLLTDLEAPGVTVANDNSLLIAMAGSSSASDSINITHPSGMTNEGFYSLTGTYNVGVSIASDEVDAGATGDKIFTNNNGSMAVAGLVTINSADAELIGLLTLTEGRWDQQYTKLNYMFEEIYGYIGHHSLYEAYGEDSWENIAVQLNDDFIFLYNEIFTTTPPHTFADNQMWGTVRGYINSMLDAIYNELI